SGRRRGAGRAATGGGGQGGQGEEGLCPRRAGGGGPPRRRLLHERQREAPDYMKFCVSARGNITHFESPFGLTHITGNEGYVLCVDNDRRIGLAFDAGLAQDGWGAPTVSQPSGPGTLPLVVTRTSEDGRVQLTQTFTRNVAERGVDVKMDVKNL